jgi:hypothetical protein
MIAQIALVWSEVLRWGTHKTRVRLGILEMDLKELVPSFRLKHSRQAIERR